MNMIEEFKNNKLWIHIRKDQRELIKDLQDILEDVTYSSGDDLNDEHILNRAFKTGEVWFRCDDGVHYTTEYPRTAECYHVSPWIYQNGQIVDIEEIVSGAKLEEINEEEFDSIFGE